MFEGANFDRRTGRIRPLSPNLGAWRAADPRQPPQNLSDPFSRQRLFADSTGGAPVVRTPFAPGPKVMESDELIARSYDFFEATHAKWEAQFRDYVLTKGVPTAKLDIYNTSFAQN
jgi:hypothetical protein